MPRDTLYTLTGDKLALVQAARKRAQELHERAQEADRHVAQLVAMVEPRVLDPESGVQVDLQRGIIFRESDESEDTDGE